VKVLLKMGADPAVAVGFFNRCPHCYDCCPPVGEQLIRAAASRGPTPLRLDATDEGGNTYLHFAASVGSPGLVKRLLAEGLDVSAMSTGKGELSRGYATGSTPLHIAAARCDVQTVTALIMAKASTSATDGEGKLPSEVACRTVDNVHEFESRAAIAQLLPLPAGKPR
jgi:ankyrin repeat protein